MKDRQDTWGKKDWNSDGVTGYTQGSNPRSNWITDNMGKVVIFIVAVIIILAVSVTLTANNGNDDSPRTPQQNESTN